PGAAGPRRARLAGVSGARGVGRHRAVPGAREARVAHRVGHAALPGAVPSPGWLHPAALGSRTRRRGARALGGRRCRAAAAARGRCMSFAASYVVRSLTSALASTVFLATFAMVRLFAPRRAPRYLRWFLQRRGGGFAKLGQMLAMRFDLLPRA